MLITPPDLMDQAVHFRLIMGQPVGSDNPSVLDLQKRLIAEEFDEFITATEEEPEVNQLKELADLVYVCFQYAAARGWELDEALDRVYKSNMSKLVDGKPLRREDGKVLKGPNYKPPYLEDLL
jgi:predicted HAD superfamily Cof-like phosphohydrolase